LLPEHESEPLPDTISEISSWQKNFSQLEMPAAGAIECSTAHKIFEHCRLCCNASTYKTSTPCVFVEAAAGALEYTLLLCAQYHPYTAGLIKSNSIIP